MTVKLSPVFQDAQLDSSGNPLSGGLLYTYAAGTTTPTATYTTETGNVAQANPIVLNSRGEPDNAIWLTAGTAYKFTLTTSGGTVIRTIDNVDGVNDTSSAITEWIVGPTPTYSSATIFTLSGDQTSDFQVGRRIKATLSGGSVYGRISVSAYTSLTTVTVVLDSGSLDATLSAVSYALISVTNPSIDASAVTRVVNNYGAQDVAGAKNFTDTPTVTSTDASASEGPSIVLDRNSATPANSDLLGSIQWKGRDSGAGTDTVAKIIAEWLDTTASSEDARLLIQTIVAGTLATRGYVGQGLVLGSPTGSDKGAGTVNVASGLYDNNNRAFSSTSMYESAETSLSKGTTFSVSHGLGARPRLVLVALRCTTADLNYSVGDEIPLDNLADSAGNFTATIWWNSTSVGAAITNGNLYILDKTDGAGKLITDANWRVVFRAWV